MSKFIKILRVLLGNWKRTLLILFLTSAAFLIYRRVTSEPKGVSVTRVYRMNLVSDFSANGEIKAEKEVDLKFLSPGKISWIKVKKGDSVYKGQALASLNVTSLNAYYQQSLNSLRNSQAAADSVLDSVQGHDIDETFAMKATRTNAEVGRDNSYLGTIIARDAVSNSILLSPISGTVVDTNNIVAGSNLAGSDLETKYIRIIDFSTLYFEARVGEIDFSKVKLGQEVNISLDAYPGEICKGEVTFIGRDGEQTIGGVITIPVEIKSIDCNLNIAVGLNGQAYFITSRLENVLVIPKKYLVKKDGKDYVWKQTESATKKRNFIEVKVGITNSTQAEIKDGIIEGDKIVFVP